MNPQVARLAWNLKGHSKKKTALNVSRSPAEPEIALTALLRFINSGAMRDHPDVGALRAAGSEHLKAIGQMKKEFDKLREVWLTQREVLYRTELLISSTRSGPQNCFLGPRAYFLAWVNHYGKYAWVQD